MEHRTADTLKRLNDTERALKARTTHGAGARPPLARVLTSAARPAPLQEKRQREYEDPVKAEEARELGNGAFRDAKYPEAVTHYSEAIKRNPGDHRTYSNRSAAYAKLCAFNEALKARARLRQLSSREACSSRAPCSCVRPLPARRNSCGAMAFAPCAGR